ncbi:hypothetical protein ACUN24_13635 [Pedobacter sp. WC2501]|uniref:hypothetical protein n=1 Tax=Pedobacter sp. WC2501 TaxID=3461400 RepID=UPI0040465C0A
MKKIYFIVLFFIAGRVFGQSLNLIPPPPTASALGRYGEVPVSTYSGLPQISVPLYEMSGKTLKLPISLSYHAGGIRTEENSSWVGLGWSLNAGGVITKTIRGIDDDNFGGYSLSTFPSGALTLDSYFDEVLKSRKDTEPDIYFYNFNGYSGKFILDPADKPNSNTIRAFLIPKSDIEITFSYTDHSFTAKTPDGIKYVFGVTEYNNVTSIVCQDAKNNPGMLDAQMGGGFNTSWFMSSMEAPNGNEKITFSYSDENYKYQTPKSGRSGYRTDGSLYSLSYSYSINNISGKVLSEINFPATGQQLVFNANKVREDLGVIYTAGAKALEEILVKNMTNNNILKKIIFNTDYFNTGSMRFDVNQVSAAEKYQYKRLRLLSVREVSGTEAVSKPPYLFEYNTTNLPPKNSEFQDHWGFINQISDERYNYYSDNYLIPGFIGEMDRSNEYFGVQCNDYSNFVPFRTTAIGYLNKIGVDREPNEEATKAGILRKITYPTGGYTEFEFESNKYAFINQQEHYEPKYVSETLTAFTERPGNNFPGAIENEEKITTFTVEENKAYEVAFDLENSSGQSGINFTDNEISLTGTVNGIETNVLKLYYDWSPYYDPYRIIYFDEAANQLANVPLNISGANYTAYDDTAVPTNEGISRKVIHGTRSVRLKPGVVYKLKAKRSYNAYQNCSNPGQAGCLINNNFANIEMITPVLKEIPRDATTLVENLGAGLRIKQITDKSNDSSPALTTEYEYRLYDETGHSKLVSSGVLLSKPVHHYNQLYHYESSTYGCNDCDVVTINNGCMQYTHSVFNVFTLASNLQVPLSTTQGNYVGYREVKVSKKNNGFSINRFTSPYEFPDILPDRYNSYKYLSNGVGWAEFNMVVEYNNLEYARLFIPTRSNDWKRGLVDSVSVFDEGYQKISGERNIYNFNNVGSEIRSLNMFFNSIKLSPSGSIAERQADYVEYKETSGWPSLMRQISSKDYADKHVFNYTDYEYASLSHIKPTLIRSRGSDGGNVSQTFILAADKPSNVSTPQAVLNEMVDNRHMLYSVLKEETIKNNISISGKKNAYKFENGNILLSNTEISLTGNYEPRISYDNYDVLGNLLSYTNDGKKNVYLWSYNGQYPIVEIKNAEYSVVESIMGGSTAVSNLRNSYPTDLQVNTLIAALRDSPELKNSEILGFTYRPLVGINTISDAKRMTTYYEYDSFQRLKSVKDQNGNILKQTDYHYKN